MCNNITEKKKFANIEHTLFTKFKNNGYIFNTPRMSYLWFLEKTIISLIVFISGVQKYEYK